MLQPSASHFSIPDLRWNNPLKSQKKRIMCILKCKAQRKRRFTYSVIWQVLVLLKGPLHRQLVNSSKEETLNSISFPFRRIIVGFSPSPPSGYLLSIIKLDLPPGKIKDLIQSWNKSLFFLLLVLILSSESEITVSFVNEAFIMSEQQNKPKIQ